MGFEARDGFEGSWLISGALRVARYTLGSLPEKKKNVREESLDGRKWLPTCDESVELKGGILCLDSTLTHLRLSQNNQQREARNGKKQQI